MASFNERKANADGTYSTLVHGTGSDFIQPIDIQSRLAQTIQTHNAVSVVASNYSSGSWIDCDGFDKLAITFSNDAATASFVDVSWSNDGTNTHANDSSVVANNSVQRKTGIVDIKARYAKLTINNLDTVAHTMSAWAYLKA